ncbi:uncharacterized protein LOC107266974 isoform X2 [Cephus cinctus]|uniref:Uncharacterized protein LOC107266974 isoform X2 n=1 Tax=Cephus cinctus TaxID=211228 RepID=A0AAJ7REZ2_CEPCN|nr:uncharacterized protein LOC107266974 isoform X2 [Cephus cinctus]
MTSSKVKSSKLQNDEINLSKAKAKKSCSGYVVTESDDKNEKIHNRPRTAGTQNLSKIQVIESNLNTILRIPKLEEMEREINLQSSTMLNSTEVRKIEEKLESFSGLQKVKELKVPKLGTVSLYPSFNKAMSIESLDEVYKCSNENKKSLEFPKITDALIYPENAARLNKPENRPEEGDSVDKEDEERTPTKDLERGYERTTKRSQNFLKVPKFSTLSSYPSFSSLVTDSLDNEDNSVFSSQAPSITATSNEFKIPKVKSEKKTDKVESNKLPNSIESKKKYSLKHSVKYAYRALKFLTPNKNLNFTSKTYDSLEKSTSSSTRSSSSSDISESKNKSVCRKKRLSDSSLNFETVCSKLQEKASTHLDDGFLVSHSKFLERTESVTIPTTTRTTSGSSTKFDEPILVNDFSKTLKKIPEIRMFPRKNKDRCLACLYKTFEEPIKVKEELPVTVLKSILEKPKLKISHSESSSISLPDLDTISKLESECEEGKSFDQSKGIDASHLSSPAQSVLSRYMTEVTKSPLRMSENHFQQTVSQSISPQASQILKPTSKSLSVSSEHSKASSISGQSSESDDTQIPTDQKLSSYKYFVPCHAPLNLRPSLEPLKALKFKKPMSMHSRSASVVKAADGSDLEESTDDSFDVKQETIRNFTMKDPSKIIDGSEEEDSIVSMRRSTENLENFPKGTKSFETMETNNELTDSRTMDAVEDEVEMRNKNSLEKSKILMKMKSVSGDISKLKSFDDTRLYKSMDDKKSHKLMQSQSTMNLKLNSAKSEKESDTRTSCNDSNILSESKSKFKKPANEKLSLILSNDLIKRLEKSISDNDTALEILKILTTEYLEKIADDKKWSISKRIEKSNIIATNLLKLLVESKQYLHPDKFPSNLEFSSKQPLLCNSRQLKRNLPPKSYNLVAPILGLEKEYHKKSTTERKESQKSKLSKTHSIRRKSSETSFDLIVYPPSSRRSDLSDSSEKAAFQQQLNPYALFLKKSRRKAVTWRPLKEIDLKGYDPEATLNMRATRITNKICEDFCQWLRGLGGTNEGIDEEVLKDMFQIDFMADACRTVQVMIKEMPMVPTAVALTRNTPDAGELVLTRKHLIRDAKAERKSKKTIGFGTSLPKELKIIPPKNQVEAKWLQCENVPKDLETMSAVWKGITHLDSVKGFTHWMKNHHNTPLPKILKSASSTFPSETRQSQDHGFAHMELNLDQIKSLKVVDIDTENSYV